MELSIKDRLYIPALLPKDGNFKEFNLKKEILRKVEISESERTEVNLRENSETKRIEWDTEKDNPLIIDFSKDECDYLKKVCEKLSDETLPDDMWATVERIFDSIV
ncbi:MAG: RNA-binding protein [Rikenellaceae bacterium]